MSRRCEEVEIRQRFAELRRSVTGSASPFDHLRARMAAARGQRWRPSLRLAFAAAVAAAIAFTVPSLYHQLSPGELPALPGGSWTGPTYFLRNVPGASTCAPCRPLVGGPARWRRRLAP